jgi:hypothetical protein
VKVVALDLDDTVWSTLAWIRKLMPIGNEIIREKLPNAYRGGLRYSGDSAATAAVRGSGCSSDGGGDGGPSIRTLRETMANYNAQFP